MGIQREIEEGKNEAFCLCFLLLLVGEKDLHSIGPVEGNDGMQMVILHSFFAGENKGEKEMVRSIHAQVV